jgi:hypothetical protein
MVRIAWDLEKTGGGGRVLGRGYGRDLGKGWKEIERRS